MKYNSSIISICIVAVFALGQSCSSPLPADEAGNWERMSIENPPPRRDLLSACEFAVQQAGYPKGKIDASRGTVYSDWLIDLQPFRNKGRRYQAIIRVFDENGVCVVKTRVIAERNVEMNETLESGAADWEELADDRGRARTLMQYLKSQLFLQNSNG